MSHMFNSFWFEISVANKWIREGAQAFKRKCPLEKTAHPSAYPSLKYNIHHK